MNARSQAIAYIVFLYCISPLFVQAQMLGTPFVDAYSKADYGFGTQNWDIEQAENRILYFANNDGLLEFDGAHWQLFPLPNRTVLRSINIQEETIYAGGQNEFGRFRPHPQSKWRFESLTQFIPEVHRDFEDVWDMQQIDGTIYFRASEKVFIYQKEKFQVIEDIPIQFLDKVKNQIFVQGRAGPIYYLEESRLQLIAGSDFLAGMEVRKILPFGDDYLIATRKNGLYLFSNNTFSKWENQRDDLFREQFINTLDVLSNGDLVIGTGFTGVVIIDSTGQFKYQVTAEDGLSNNRVISTFVDRQKNLWLGLDNGISMIRTNSPFYRIYPDGDLEGAGYDVAVLNDKIYFGTSSGLFYTQWGKQTIINDFKLVDNTSGQVWGLDVIDERLILSHNDGAFLIKEGQATRFFGETGAWLFNPDQLQQQLVFSGNYKGISILDRESLESLYTISGLNESSRFIVQDKDGSYWMSHPYRGVFKIDSPHDVTKRKVRLMGLEQGLPSNLHNHIFKINNQILICAEKGVFTFDNLREVFVHYEPMEELLGADLKIRRLFEGKEGNVWFITEKEIGVLEIEETGLERKITKRVFPTLKRLMNGGWEKIYIYDKNNVFISTINGFLHYNGDHPAEDLPPFNILLNSIRINKDSVLYASGLDPDFTLKHHQNSLLFNVCATEYVNNSGVKLQYLLEGFDEDWSVPSDLRSKEYTNLPAGNYTLMVKGINQDGTLSTVYNFPFSIERPWHASFTAIGIYLIFLAGITYLLFRRSKKKFQALEEKVDSTVKKSNAEIQRLETEKIHAELEHKKRALVSATLHLVQKNDTMANIADQIVEIKKGSQDPKVNRQLQKLIHFLKQDEFIDEGWEQVMYHFNELNEGYFDRLKKEYPSLTPKDLKLCAYLKMNLTTKEMATLMNVSLRGVEASRYRLRKKLELETEENLTEFLMGF